MLILSILGLLVGMIAMIIAIMFLAQAMNPKLPKPRNVIIMAYFSLAALMFAVAYLTSSQL